MFNTKLEVDKHVETCLKNINNDTERNLRCFAFARLYFKVGEYEQARRYVSNYLISKPTSAEALSFLGKTLEKQGKIEAAMDAYRNSIDIDPKQNSLLLKVCELLCSDNIPVDIPSLQFYCEKAQRIDPQNPIVYNLKERLVAAESQDPNDISKLLLTELESRSADVQLRVRLLRHLLQNNQIKEAYKHASDIEWKSMPIFLNSISWYEVVSEVLVRYQKENVTNLNLTWEFWMLFVTVLDKLAALVLNEHFNNVKSSSECTSAVFNLDQTLNVAAKSVSNCPERPLLQEFLSHYRAQLCFHLSTLLFKQAKSDLIKYKDALNASLPLLFVAYHTQPVELHCLWLDHSPEIYKLQVQKWHREAAFRCSQAGHILLSAAKDRKIVIMEKVVQHSSGLWREQLFKKVFITRDEQFKIKSSYFVTCPQLVDIPSQLPDSTILAKYDEYAQVMYPDSLHNLVWICTNKKLSTFKCTIFEGLQYSVKNLNNCSAESLNVLDIDSFIYLTTLTTQGQEENKIFFNGDKPPLIPASISDQLGTLNHAKWFKAAYKMYKNEYGFNLNEVRLNLIRGIEVVRCVGNHGIDVKLLVKLANTFTERAKKLTKQSEIEFNEARADLYWKSALPILEKLQKNQAVSYGINRLFEYKSKDLTQFEISKYVEEAKLFNGAQLMKKKEFEKALHIFDGLKNPYASYHQAQIYKTMAEEQLNQNKENVTSEMRSQHVILLSRSRDCLYLTLDRLRDPAIDRKHSLNKQLGTEIEKIERMLSRIDSDVYIRNDCDNLSDENVSSVGSIGDHANNYYSSTLYPNESLTPHLDRTPFSNRYKLEMPNRREARPSPERLDAQLRQMQASRDATLSHIIEQNRLMVDSHRSLIEEFRWLKDTVTNINTSVNDVKTSKASGREELQSIKDSITELKTVVEEFQSFRDITDLVHEMKKEIADLKKDQAKSKNQLSEEDLYVLDDEYTGDYGINANATAFNPTNLYPNYHARMPAAYPPPPALYPGMYPVYPYANLGLPQAAALSFGQDPQIDFRALNLPQNLTQASFGQHTLPQAKPPCDATHSNLPLNLVLPPSLMHLQQAAGIELPPMMRDSTSVTTIPTTSSLFSSVINSAPTTETPLNATQNLAQSSFKQNVLSDPSIVLPCFQTSKNFRSPSAVTTTSITPGLFSSVTTTASTTEAPLNTSQNLKPQVKPPGDATLPNLPINFALPPSLMHLQQAAGIEVPPMMRDSTPVTTIPATSNLFSSVITTASTTETPLSTTQNLAQSSFKQHVLPDPSIVLPCFQTSKNFRSPSAVTTTSITPGLFSSVTTTASTTEAPFNVVITTSDPLPKTTIATTQVLSVTIPPQHLKGSVAPKTTQPHNYQIPLPISYSTVATTPAIIHQSSPVAVTQGLFPSVEPPLYSAVTKNVNLGLQIEKSLNQSFNTSTDSNKGNTSSPTVEEDPCPDFKPIVPLPDEVPVNTGEENENILFSNRAKLFRYTSNEWKERGIGVLKVLEDKDTKKVRILMRRDQVHKICANHFLTKDMNITRMQNNNLAFVWAANDYAEQQSVAETFCVKFKTEEIANDFFRVFEQSKKNLPETPKSEDKKDKQPQIKNTESPSLGGFTFTSTPTFKPKEDAVPSVDSAPVDVVKNSPFASFTFGSKLSTPTSKMFPTTAVVETTKPPVEEGGIDFVPTAEFKPVIPLPDVVELKTGEENAEILFDCSATLLKYDTLCKEWKECGVGTMKVLKEERIIRLLMRRNQVLKICCNHQLLKKITFMKTSESSKTVSWCAQDFSDGTMKPEMFTIKFKHPNDEQAFLKAVTSAQKLLGDDNLIKSDANDVTSNSTRERERKEEKKVKSEPPEVPKSTWGDKFKPKAGTWKCKVCFIHNEAKDHYCVACESPKSNTSPKKSSEVVFSFGIQSPNSSSTPAINTSQFSFGVPTSTAAPTSFSFAQVPSSDVFKAKGDHIQRNEDDSGKSTTSSQPKASERKSQDSVGGEQFKPNSCSWECEHCFLTNDSDKLVCVSCQNSKKDTTTTAPANLWGDQFKPKQGSWECKVCLVRNDSDKVYCLSCESPKDDTISKKEVKVTTTDVQFKFGFPSGVVTMASSTFGFTTQPATSFTFGTKPSTSEGNFSFSTTDENKDRFVFGSPQQHAFEFTPRSPRRHSSGCQGEEESDNFVEDEGDHIYFKPIIPLPDKVDLKTGEEAEEPLYCHRAKLFRFVDGEWKERGIGDLKILYNTDSKKLRVLMRREQVLKICLNHTLTSNIEYKQKDDKTWLFSAPDYSEGEINHWQFCLRFKTSEVAQQFKKAVNDALKKSHSASTEDGVILKDDTSEIEFVSESQVTPEEEQEAIQLKLPPKYMSYRQLPDCTCETCKQDDVILKELFQNIPESNKNKTEQAAKSSTSLNASVSKSILAKPKLLLSPETTKTETDTFKSFTFSLKTEATSATTSVTTSITTSNTFTETTPSKSPFENINFTSPSTSGGNIFSDPKTKNIFRTSGNIFASDNLFDTKNNMFTTSFNTSQAKGDQIEPKKIESVLKFDSDLSFSSLQDAPNVLMLGKKFEEGDKPFAHLGSGAPVFASLAQSNQKKRETHSGDEGDESGHEGGDGYDPHYDPIIDLPAAIVVRTGEEDEVPIFNERTKLYRYDDKTKEWKERGVGQLKILHHPKNGTYRFILRRELVHKVVLNMLITPKIDLQPMITSDRAWLWVGINHSDDASQVEKLAAKFKSVEMANTFHNAVESAIAALKEHREKNLPSTIQNFGDVSGDDHSEGRDEEDDEDDDDCEDEEDEEERTVLFMKPCLLQDEESSGQWTDLAAGEIIMYYDPDTCSSRIYMCDESCKEVSNTIIGTNTEMMIDDNTCVWKAVEWADSNPRWHTLKATFSTVKEAEEFHCKYVESVQFAHENGVVDELLTDVGE